MTPPLVRVWKRGAIAVRLTGHEGKDRALRFVMDRWAAYLGTAVTDTGPLLVLTLPDVEHRAALVENVVPTIRSIVRAKPLSPEAMRARHEKMLAKINALEVQCGLPLTARSDVGL